MRLPRETGNLPYHFAPGRAPAFSQGRAQSRMLGLIVIALAVVALVVPTGCVRRRLAVRSNPPGALVFVDNQQIGTTPCSVDFTYYGTREIRLEKSGYETLTVNQPIPTPWYQIPPLDFVSENVVPKKIQDHRTVAFDLQPQLVVPTEQLLDRANQLRQETLQGAAAPAIALPVGPPPGMPTTAPPNFGPTVEPTPALAPTPLPPLTQTSPPSTYSTPPYAPGTPAPYSAPAPAPFSAPPVPDASQIIAPPAGTQQGPPLVSPPLR